MFAIALTPFGVFHNHHHDHHQVKCSANEKNCTHKLHIGTQTEHCLLCEAHFEKAFTAVTHHFQVSLPGRSVIKFYPLVGNSYCKLITRALRGPPNA